MVMYIEFYGYLQALNVAAAASWSRFGAAGGTVLTVLRLVVGS